jgi:hypothetical protein
MLIMQKRESTFKLDFSIKMNDKYSKNISEFTNKLHHRSNAYQRKSEIIKGKNTLAIEMLERALETLAISMKLFIQILTKISEIQNVVKDNKDLLNIIAILSTYTQKELGFMCES